ncbi:MmcB family DNA repair protein [Paenibacillus bouchesdurhonensis]|uniref:MmcB family DNA repair protein n=1 Tax=Paenibacillus bouchesdurhonensis TaxID=1870990 RepID=UPI0019004CC3|nr:MmcB family DNA repair protein [Paenibacillus bouchesdurhonensis]
MSKVRADQVKLALSKRHTDDLFLTEVKTGRTWDNKELLKFDALAMKKSWANPCLMGYEVKVSRGDFLQDQKWPGYMAYCNRFSFVCPKGLIAKDELPPEVGLIYYYPDTGALRTERAAKHRLTEIPPDIYKYMLMSRTESDSHPFFSSRREMFEAYLEEKKTCRALGRNVGSKLVNEINELRKKVSDVDWEKERLQRDSDLLQQVRELLGDYGIRLGAWNSWEDELRQRLSTGVNPQVMTVLDKVTDNVGELRKMLQPEGASGS